MLKTLVKASNITNLTDARYFSALEVEWLGYHLEQGTETYIEPQNVIAIKEWVEGPKTVGEFGLQNAATIRQAVDVIGLDVVQVGHFVTLDQIIPLNGIPIIKEFVVDEHMNKEAIREHLFMFNNYVETFLLKGNLDWNVIKNDNSDRDFLKDICSKYQIIFDIKIQPADIESFLLTIHPYGLNVVGGEEEAIGVKSFDELDELFEQLVIEE